MDDHARVEISRVMTRKELEKYLHSSVPTIEKLLRQGSIPAFKVAEHLRFRLDNIKDWIREIQK